MEKAEKKSDSLLKQDVIRELTWDTRVNETRIGVEVENGIVTLSGTLESYAERVAAEKAAHRVSGVLDVVNDMQVKYTGRRTETDIAKAVRHALEWDVFVPDERIKSSFSNGIVTLEGEVDYWSQREDAASAVRGLTGVLSIVNNLRVKSSVSALQVQKAIEDALARHAAREAKDIKLEVHDGKVTLAGKVHSWAERELVIGTVRGTRGVRGIEDHLQIFS